MSKVVRKHAFTQRKVERIIKGYNNRSYIHLLENKNEFNAFFAEFVEREWLCSKNMDEGKLKKMYVENEELFIKPLDDMEGEGIYKIKTSDITFERLLTDLKNKNLIIETIIRQHKKMIFGNESVNSARILTVLDTEGKAHVVRAGLRVGVGNSVVDNYSAGGVLYEIDVKSGIIDHKGIQGNNYDIIFHPGTETCMVGYHLPNWELAIEAVTKAAEKIPQCRFIGWDVAFTQNGVELIEGNHNPGIFTLESLGTPGAYADVVKILKS
ncbi:MAG: hypothetical protein MJZ72_08500 [Bacteroidales bacterium]|nr:hypothetical protein [Bacteroidales bacterium]